MDLREGPSLQLPEGTRRRKPVFRKEGLHPLPSPQRCVPQSLSRGPRLDSLESKVSLPPPEQGGSLVLLFLPVKLPGSTIPSPPPSGAGTTPSGTSGLGGRQSVGKPRRALGTDTPPSTECFPRGSPRRVRGSPPSALPAPRCATLAARHTRARFRSEPTPAYTLRLSRPRTAASADHRMYAPEHPTLAFHFVSVRDGEQAPVRPGCRAAPPSQRARGRHFRQTAPGGGHFRAHRQPPRPRGSSPSPRPGQGQEPVVADWGGGGARGEWEIKRRRRVRGQGDAQFRETAWAPSTEIRLAAGAVALR